MNYALTTLVREWLERQGTVNYSSISRAVAALECCKLELYARVARPYEDRKMVENGDVW